MLTDNDFGFESACESKHLAIINYLIFDYKINRTRDMNAFLAKNNHDEFIKKVEGLFQLRFLNRTLKKDFGSDNRVNKQNKI